MPLIEKLPDDRQQSPALSKTPFSSGKQASAAPDGSSSKPDGEVTSTRPQDDTTSTKPSLPPPLASMQDRSVEDVASMMNRMPLFMTSLDETDGAGGENVDLEALKALAFEGSPTEVAKNFKEQGNECYKARVWKDAVEFYTKGLAVLEGSRKKIQEGGAGTDTEGNEDDGKVDVKEAKDIAETLLVNRAASNLELQNYRRVIQDCTKALVFNHSNLKAHYRLIVAHLALTALPAANAAMTNALSHHPADPSLIKLQSRIAEKQGSVDAKQREVSQREQRGKVEARALALGLKARGIRTRTTDKSPELEDAVIHLEQSDDPSSVLFLPTLFLYPLASQTDLIKAMPETDSLQEHLTYILPTPWDTHGEYTVASVDCYMETPSGGLVKVGKKLPMRKLLSEGNVEVLDGLVKILVVPRTRSKEWIDSFKKRSGKSSS
ncbi:MAG: hypothetical protein M1837_001857 [Sclerophora amabilis]|nr:MAG: hypothetical protein M1837_001857 [Sclerophora amabilis]